LDATVPQLQAESDEVFNGLLDERLAPLPGLLCLLETLDKRQIPKAITTSSRRHFVDRCLEIAELDGRFQFVLSAEDVRQGKPHPEIYGAAAQRFNVEAGAMLVLEDSQNGVRAAIDAGAFTVAVPGEHSREHDFSGAQFVADNLEDARIYQVLGIE
jgi:HAD superfamily hydrolase (TIGR01509 family)